jgi:hypothetical protein
MAPVGSLIVILPFALHPSLALGLQDREARLSHGDDDAAHAADLGDFEVDDVDFGVSRRRTSRLDSAPRLATSLGLGVYSVL